MLSSIKGKKELLSAKSEDKKCEDQQNSTKLCLLESELLKTKERVQELEQTNDRLEEYHTRVLELEKLLVQDNPARTDTISSCRTLKDNEESFHEEYQVDIIRNYSFGKTRRLGVDLLLGGVNEDTYHIMMLSKGFRSRAWLLGFIVFLSQVFLCGLTIYSQLNASSNKFGNYTPLDLPIRTRRDVTVLQFFAIIIAVYSQDDMFNAIATPIDLRLNGPNPWGGLPITEEEKRTKYVWFKKIFLPNAMKGIAGMLVVLTSVMVILQSEEVIDLLMNFTALFVISNIDNVVFTVVRRGFFGIKLQHEAILSQEVDLSPNTVETHTKRKGICSDTYFFKSLILNFFLTSYLVIWAIVLYSQESGWMARQKYPECQEEVPVFNTKWPLLQNDNCDMLFNNVRCGYDGGDCEGFNALYPDCKVEDAFRVADGKCDGFPYNSVECRFDGGDCRRDAIYCDSSKLGTIGDGICDKDLNTHECFYDRGDCIDNNLSCTYVTGDGDRAIIPGDGICGVPQDMMIPGVIGNMLNITSDGLYSGREACSFDGGDCLHPRYPGCYFDDSFPNFLEEIGDGICQNYFPYNTEACFFDGGDCLDFNEKYPECRGPQPEKIGNGICDVDYNVATCGFDKGDCCVGLRNDGLCEMKYNIEECAFDAGDCLNFNEMFPDCIVLEYESWSRSRIGDGVCNPTDYNTKECGFDGGDCLEFNKKFPNCTVSFPEWLGDGYCFGGDMNTPECGWDGGDCLKFNEKYPNCTDRLAWKVGDGICDSVVEGKLYNTEECGWDGGDCLEFNAEFNAKYPECYVLEPELVGDGFCNEEYNTTRCKWDGGDCCFGDGEYCEDFNSYLKQKYPNCNVDEPQLVGNGGCDLGEYNTVECGFDDGDCDDFNERYPNCMVEISNWVGDGVCDGGEHNTIECGFDGGDCDDFNEQLKQSYPNCTVGKPSLVGNGYCDGGEYNTVECGFDGRDCNNFNERYPNCMVELPNWVGDGVCDEGEYNTVECGFDGGDCCKVSVPSFIGNGRCDGGEYNSIECEWDGGDCLEFNEKYPYCIVNMPFLIGNGFCDEGESNTEECGFDGGDCDKMNSQLKEKYPNCFGTSPSQVGNGFCDEGKYNTVECGFDGGDCNKLNSQLKEKYPNCVVTSPSWVGDGICDVDNNMEECGFDDGDCVAFNENYPNCDVDKPYKVGDGECNGAEYNVTECMWDGGDCV